MQDLNVRAAVGSRINSEIKESENQSEIHKSLLLLTLGETRLMNVVTPKVQWRMMTWVNQNTKIHQPPSSGTRRMSVTIVIKNMKGS